MKKILILGVNGFIGSHLSEAILRETNWQIYGMDISSNKLGESLQHQNLHFTEGDITINKEWVEYHIKKCDVILPLVAIATPSSYVKEPLRVFELDFEANLSIIRSCVKYEKRVIFPSTSEVYGMSTDTTFDEEQSNFILGPITKQRWIYSCSKQLMDRVIYAHGQEDGLDFTLFRPFNWFGPKLDDVFESAQGRSRVLSQFISNVIYGKDIALVAGGLQRRCFTYIDDGIQALMAIIRNHSHSASRRIFNIGNPDNDVSIRQLAELILQEARAIDLFSSMANQSRIVSVSPEEYYGAGYQDIAARVPSIDNANKHLGWAPSVSLLQGVQSTLSYYAKEATPQQLQSLA